MQEDEAQSLRNEIPCTIQFFRIIPETFVYWVQTNTQIPQRKRECCWGTTNLHANNNVNNPEMMGGLPSSSEYGGFLGDADAATEGAAVGVQAEAMQPLYRP